MNPTLKIPQLDIISKDLHKLPLLVCGERGAGKTCAIKSLVNHILQSDGKDICFKVFDPSLAWLQLPPFKKIFRVSEKTIRRNQINNECNVIFLTGELTINDRFSFVASIIGGDYSERYHQIIKNGHESLKGEPLIIYIVEEAQVVVGSYALRSRNGSSDIMKDFISMGRNLGFSERGLSAILSTQRLSEVSSQVVERGNLLIGKMSGDNNLRKLKRATSYGLLDKVRKLERYQWLYWNGRTSKVFKIPQWILPITEWTPEPPKKKHGILYRLLYPNRT